MNHPFHTFNPGDIAIFNKDCRWWPERIEGEVEIISAIPGTFLYICNSLYEVPRNEAMFMANQPANRRQIHAKFLTPKWNMPDVNLSVEGLL